MPEQDDKREGSARGDKPGDRRFWRALAGDKRPDGAGEKIDSSAATGSKSTETPAQTMDDPRVQPAVEVAANPIKDPIRGPVENPVKDLDRDSAAGTGPDAIDLTPGDEQRLNPAERAARREALRSMLHRSEARHNNVRRKRRPVLTAGTQVRVASGPHVGEEGVILDADYIESRVLLALGGNQTPTWVSFEQVAGPRRKN